MALEKGTPSHATTKAELARAIDKHPAAVRRLLPASENPELRTVVAIAQALGAELKLVPVTRTLRKRTVHDDPERRSAA